MGHLISESKERHSLIAHHPRKEAFAAHLFSVVMFGLCAVFLFVAIFWDW